MGHAETEARPPRCLKLWGLAGGYCKFGFRGLGFRVLLPTGLDLGFGVWGFFATGLGLGFRV